MWFGGVFCRFWRSKKLTKTYLLLCKEGFTDYPTLLAKRASNHSSNFSPIVGKTLNLKSSETKLFRLFWVSRDTA